MQPVGQKAAQGPRLAGTGLRLALLLGIACLLLSARSGPAAGGPGHGADPAYPGDQYLRRFPEPSLDTPPTLEQLNKLRVYDFDPKQGYALDGFTLWTIDDLGRPDPAQQQYLKLVGRDLVHGDYHLVVMLKNAPSLNDLFFYVRYDQDRWHPTMIRPGSAFGFEGDRLWFGKIEVPGVVVGAMTRVRPDIHDGTKLADGVVCEISFTERPFDYKENWLNHAPDKERNRAANIQAYSQAPNKDDLSGCTVVLYWEEVNVGDYNNDGEVSMTDLEPIGRRYGKLSTDAYEDAWDRLPDGNDDGEVNRRDVWLIDENYGALLSGYRVYRRPAGRPRQEEVLLLHRTSPILPLSVHRPLAWDPSAKISYRYYDREIQRSLVPKDYIYRIVPYDAPDDKEGQGSDIEVMVRVSAQGVSVVETYGPQKERKPGRMR